MSKYIILISLLLIGCTTSIHKEPTYTIIVDGIKYENAKSRYTHIDSDIRIGNNTTIVSFIHDQKLKVIKCNTLLIEEELNLEKK